jgi:hypothetical protein
MPHFMQEALDKLKAMSLEEFAKELERLGFLEICENVTFHVTHHPPVVFDSQGNDVTHEFQYFIKEHNALPNTLETD